MLTFSNKRKKVRKLFRTAANCIRKDVNSKLSCGRRLSQDHYPDDSATADFFPNTRDGR
jgi:hypothetical protein